MALAGEQHDVARAGALDGRLDGGPAVGDDQQVVVAPLAGGLRATRDLVEDRVAVLAARVLVGDDDDPGSLAGDPAHQRALGRVPLAGRAEDGDQSPTGRRRQRRQEVEDGLERRRAVGEVDDDAERLAELDPLHPPGHDADRGEAGADRGRVEADRLAERHDRERVVDVEPADEAEIDDRAPRRGVVGDPEAVLVLLDAGGADVGRRVGAVGQDPGAGLLGDADEGGRARIVGVDDPGRGPRSWPGLATCGARRSNRRSFASRYASHVPCSSRCSWVRLVRIATS